MATNTDGPLAAPIFVFGSNEAGRHGAGAALFARRHHGAVYGVGRGRTGNAYALPTKDGRIRTLPLEAIAANVDEFIRYARANPALTFTVTRIGCGLAGYSDAQIAPLFRSAPANCILPAGWLAAFGSTSSGEQVVRLSSGDSFGSAINFGHDSQS